MHNWWHYCLYLLEAGDVPGAVEIYDAVLHNSRSAGVAMEMLDAAALLWRLHLEGIDQYYLVNVHFLHPYSDAQPVATLRSYYQQAEQTYGVGWSYLAAINFIESNFGRINGPSSAGAEGPMQFIPGTWVEYGQGGNINDPHDAIMAAARLLVNNHWAVNPRQAIWHYNNDYDYVDSVEFFARAIRADPTFLDRLYYWNTTG